MHKGTCLGRSLLAKYNYNYTYPYTGIPGTVQETIKDAILTSSGNYPKLIEHPKLRQHYGKITRYPVAVMLGLWTGKTRSKYWYGSTVLLNE